MAIQHMASILQQHSYPEVKHICLGKNFVFRELACLDSGVINLLHNWIPPTNLDVSGYISIKMKSVFWIGARSISRECVVVYGGNCSEECNLVPQPLVRHFMDGETAQETFQVLTETLVVSPRIPKLLHSCVCQCPSYRHANTHIILFTPGLKNREYDKVEDMHDTRVPVHNDEAFQHGIRFKGKVTGLVYTTQKNGVVLFVLVYRSNIAQANPTLMDTYTR